jgi:hypothetical protein
VMILNSANDFRAKLRFPRAVGEPPRAPSGSHLTRFSRRSLRLALQSTARTSYMQNGLLNKDNKNPNLFELRVQISLGFIQTNTRVSQPCNKIYLTRLDISIVSVSFLIKGASSAIMSLVKSGKLSF